MSSVGAFRSQCMLGIYLTHTVQTATFDFYCTMVHNSDLVGPAIAVGRCLIDVTFPMILTMAEPIAILFGVGVVLGELRIFLIKFAPALAAHATTFAAAATVFHDTLDAALDAIKIIVFAVQAAVDALTRRASPTVPRITWPSHSISVASVTTFAGELVGCSSFSTADALGFLVQSATSDAVCPIARMLTPIRGGALVVTVLSPFTVDPTPFPGTNCEPPPQPGAVVCTALQTGGLLVEVALPTLLVVIVFVSIAGPVTTLVRRVWSIAVELPSIIVRTFENTCGG